MGKITDIKPQAKNKSRVSLFVDGEFVCGLEKLSVASARLKIGDEVDPDKLNAVVEESERTAAFEKAVAYLGRSPRTEKEMRTYLVGKGFSMKVVIYAVDKLREYGYLNDAEYCRTFIRVYGEKAGVRKLAAKLYEKGVPREMIDAELEKSDDGAETAIALAKKYISTRKCDRRKVMAFLAGRGFEYDTIREAVSELDFDGDDDDF